MNTRDKTMFTKHGTKEAVEQGCCCVECCAQRARELTPEATTKLATALDEALNTLRQPGDSFMVILTLGTGGKWFAEIPGITRRHGPYETGLEAATEFFKAIGSSSTGE